MQSPDFKIGMNETALGTGVPYWIKVWIVLLLGSFFCADFLRRTVWRSWWWGRWDIAKPSWHFSSASSLTLNLHSRSSSSIRCLQFAGQCRNVVDTCMHCIVSGWKDNHCQNSFLSGRPCGRGGWKQRKGEKEAHHSSLNAYYSIV